MLTIEQCRGARGLLGWTQQDLANACGLSKTAINNFEKGHSDIKTESLRAIRLAFESSDIEFLGLEGISKRTETFKTLRGENALSELIDDIHVTLNHQTGSEILISFITQNIAERITTQKLFNHIEFLKNNNIKQRILCSEGLKQVLSPTDECRWINQENAQMGTTTFIYGDKIAIELWDQSTIIIAKSHDANTAERGRFEQIWKTALIPDQISTQSQETAQKSEA
jgi:transcriptional regulator with XRE-family HTH domain